MASVTRKTQGGREGWRIRFYCEKRRRELYLPGVSRKVEKMAETVAGHCEALAQAKANNVSPDPAARNWANGTTGKLRENLVAWELAEPIAPKLSTDAGRLLGPFCDEYVSGRTDLARGTAEQYGYCRKVLVEYFGERRTLAEITPADAERWRRWLLARVVKPATETTPAEVMAIATVSRYVKRAKTMFAGAVAGRLLAESPFAKLKSGNESNSARHRFITPAMTAQVLDACPDADWRVIFVLARYCGLRCPSEVLGLRWSDVDWAAGRLRIDSPKTGLRFCPIFPEVLPVLSEAHYLAADGAVYCVGRYRAGANLGTEFKRIVERAGVIPWPKPFINLRSTRRTELQERFPDHVINNWLGHSGAVAEKHYLQVTDEHWGQAVSDGSPTGSPIPPETRGKLDSGSPTGSPIANNSGPSLPIPETKKPRENRGFDGLQWVQTGCLATPQGLEP